MGVEYYLFAFFVFGLVGLLIALYKRTPRAEKKREERTYARENKLFKLYQNIEDMLDGFEEYVEELQRNMEKERDGIVSRLEALERAAQGPQSAPLEPAVGPGILRDADTETAPETDAGAALRVVTPPATDAAADLAAVLKAPAVQEIPPDAAPAQREPALPEDLADIASEAQGALPEPDIEAADASGEEPAEATPVLAAGKSRELSLREKVMLLYKSEMSAAGIAKTLSISRNEVALMLEMDRSAQTPPN